MEESVKKKQQQQQQQKYINFIEFNKKKKDTKTRENTVSL